LILSVVDTANPVARRVAAMIRNTIPVCPSFGRAQIADDYEQHVRTLAGLGSNPNVAAAVVLSLEPVAARNVAERIARSGRPVEVVTFDEAGGTIRATEQASRAAMHFVLEASGLTREPAPWTALTLGVECGGSDATSGVVSNPVVGLVADRVVAAGGTVILSETVEWMGAEHILMQRATTPELATKIHEAVKWYEEYAKSLGADLRGANPAPDNIAGGLSTIEEKAIGAIRKAGSSPISGLLRFGERPTTRGLVLMDAPAPAVENMTGLGAAGAQVVIFSTGKGNPVGCPVSPTIKVTGNPRTITKQADSIDVDVSPVLTAGMSLEAAADRLWGNLEQVLHGRFVKGEVIGDIEIAISRIGFST
jgi:altronate dehydratase large subunit